MWSKTQHRQQKPHIKCHIQTELVVAMLPPSIKHKHQSNAAKAVAYVKSQLRVQQVHGLRQLGSSSVFFSTHTHTHTQNFGLGMNLRPRGNTTIATAVVASWTRALTTLITWFVGSSVKINIETHCTSRNLSHKVYILYKSHTNYLRIHSTDIRRQRKFQNEFSLHFIVVYKHCRVIIQIFLCNIVLRNWP